jgi:hypothetical protein
MMGKGGIRRAHWGGRSRGFLGSIPHSPASPPPSCFVGSALPQPSCRAASFPRHEDTPTRSGSIAPSHEPVAPGDKGPGRETLAPKWQDISLSLVLPRGGPFGAQARGRKRVQWGRWYPLPPQATAHHGSSIAFRCLCNVGAFGSPVCSHRGDWLFGCLAVWLFGCLAVWLFGCLAVWLFGCLAVWRGVCAYGAPGEGSQSVNLSLLSSLFYLCTGVLCLAGASQTQPIPPTHSLPVHGFPHG